MINNKYIVTNVHSLANTCARVIFQIVYFPSIAQKLYGCGQIIFIITTVNDFGVFLYFLEKIINDVL